MNYSTIERARKELNQLEHIYHYSFSVQKLVTDEKLGPDEWQKAADIAFHLSNEPCMFAEKYMNTQSSRRRRDFKRTAMEMISLQCPKSCLSSP